jgi:hypothetical protein
MCDSQRGFGLDIGFIDHFNTRLLTTLNYSAVANFTLYKSHAKSFPAHSVFTSTCLVTASIYGYSSASGLRSSLNGGSLPTASFVHRLPNRTDVVAPVVFLITSLQTDQVENTVSKSTCIVACISVASGMCLPSHCLATAVSLAP